jgi:hypothetical protein
LLIAPRRRASASLAGYLFMAASRTTIAVFIDWQNVYKTGREAFGLQGEGNDRGNFSPLELSRILVAGNGRGKSAQLVRVEIHRGLPSSARDSVGHAATRRQAAAWIKEGGSMVVPRLRALRYPPRHAANQTPVEKGIDVQLAVAVAETAVTEAVDVAILFTHDADLVPAVEMVARLRGPRHIETASWTTRAFQQRLREIPGVYRHRISGKVFDRVETRVNYAHKTS